MTLCRGRGGLLLGLILTLSWPGDGSAQIAGAPVFYSMKHDPRWAVHLDYGNGARDLDGLNWYGLRVSHALNSEAEAGPFRISLMGGVNDPPAGDASFAIGASAGLALRMRRLLQFEAQLGAGYSEGAGGGSRIDIPAGVAFGIVGSLPPLPFTRFLSRNPQFWLAPRAHFRWTDLPAGAGSALRGGVGLGGGLELRAQNGLGFQLVGERVALRDPLQPRWRTEGAFGLSIFYAWL